MKKILFALVIGSLIWACASDEEPTISQDNFDRQAMLINWADNIIVPAYEDYTADLSDLQEAKNAFIAAPTVSTLATLRDNWLTAYTSWQKVSMFEIGKAEQITLRDYTNIYPANTTQIEDHISSGEYNLELPSTRTQQGFPALDYLLNGSADTDLAIVARFNSGQNMSDYLSTVTDRLSELAAVVLADWENGYRDTFVANDGSSASSSVNKLLNDYMFYYEKSLRAGKIGIPAGVFSNTPLSDNVEAYYKKDVSKLLFEAGLQASIDFFNGVHHNGAGSGESIKSYLDFLNTISEGEQLSGLINDQFNTSQTKAALLNDNFAQQIETNNEGMLETYDALQANVILMKVDMFQALNVRVDFVDADGD